MIKAKIVILLHFLRCLMSHFTFKLKAPNYLFHHSTKMASDHYTFGPYEIDSKKVFFTTPLSYAMINLRPLLPDVLVCSMREVKRFTDLTGDKTSDLWITAQKDGLQAGQSVPHVHIHIIPRKGGDLENNDDIYEAMDEKEKELKKKPDLDDRSLEEMAHEAEEYRKLFL